MALRWLGAILIWFSLCIPAMALQQSQPELEWCLDDYPDRHHYPDQGVPYGPTVDFVQELATRAGIRIRYSPNTPFARCLLLMQQGKTDLMVRLNTDTERERYMFMLPLGAAKPEVLLVLNHSDDIHTVAELNRLNLMVIRGYTYNSNTINIIAKHPRAIVINSLEVGLQMLLRKRGDAIVTTAEYAKIRIQDKPEYQNQFKLASLVFQDADPRFIHLALSKASPHAHLRQSLEKAIASMIADNLVD